MMFDRAATWFDRPHVSPDCPDAMVDGFQALLTSSGLRSFSVRKMVVANHADGRRIVEPYLRELESEAPWLALSLGLGAHTTRVGLGSARRARTCTRDSYSP